MSHGLDIERLLRLARMPPEQREAERVRVISHLEQRGVATWSEMAEKRDLLRRQALREAERG
ncbi:MAG: hypothetical protein GWN84_08490 [Gammaproteobacteria bacterium]|nr:hypothetical protein [Gammaproteobacteria bacterium]NIR82906.1 hypothetical protein [Gammaproteobacteria bacterium]NIR90174.1 hypothetical protein [Gammaproteobacteria bacterium]NIU03733.1 hypothetical protein [Gammaproteobacteria bacterium]NIV51376.1 hypothetical protein [Gammaproteobacteria bacterium]